MTKKKIKGKRVEKIELLAEDGEIDKVLEIAKRNNIGFLFGFGVSFGRKGDHETAKKIFHRIIQLDPTFAEAWCSKGIALEKLERYDDSINCNNKALKINR